jgi:hypothetical protein
MADKIPFVGRRRTTDMPSVTGVDDDVPPTGYGLLGSSNRGGSGVVGQSSNSYGVWGRSTNVDGVYGSTNGRYGIGVSGYSSMWMGVAGRSNDGYGVHGDSFRGPGVYGHSSNSYGVYGYSSTNIGVGARSDSGIGVDGYSDSYIGMRGWSNSHFGVHGYSSNSDGVIGVSNTGPIPRPPNHAGVYGTSHYGHGVRADSYENYALYARGYEGYAAYLDGEVIVNGQLIKRAGSFKIDHPLDPANKYLSHSFVESPDMKNVYDGVVVLDDKGEADIELPDWFGALNKDFRYQLTAIGAPGPNLYIAEEISDGVTNYSNNNSSNNKNNNNRFKVAGGTSGMKVSWQVTGIRQDPYAKAHPIQVEEDKSDKERGYYIYPDLYSQPEGKGISHLLFPKDKREEVLARAVHK